MKDQAQQPVMSPLVIDILLLEEKYQEQLRAGAEFDVLKSIRVEISRLKKQMAESSEFTSDLISKRPTNSKY